MTRNLLLPLAAVSVLLLSARVQQVSAFQPQKVLTKSHACALSSLQKTTYKHSHRRHASFLAASAVTSTPGGEKDSDSPVSSTSSTTASSTNNAKTNTKKNKRNSLDMPWSDFHNHALHDNLPKYIRYLPGQKAPQTYALWRTMLQEVPELSGYPIDFLQQQYKPTKTKTAKKQALDDKTSSTGSDATPEMLPFLNNFYFEASGGLSGQVYGVPGLKDGTRIETSPVGQVEVTIPLGYVLTEDGDVAYELGTPLSETTAAKQGGYSLDGMTRSVGQAASDSATALMTMKRQQQQSQGGVQEEDPNVMLVRLGATTGMLVAGATAASMLSHHLTVNVFWV